MHDTCHIPCVSPVAVSKGCTCLAVANKPEPSGHHNDASDASPTGSVAMFCWCLEQSSRLAKICGKLIKRPCCASAVDVPQQYKRIEVTSKQHLLPHGLFQHRLGQFCFHHILPVIFVVLCRRAKVGHLCMHLGWMPHDHDTKMLWLAEVLTAFLEQPC